MYPHTITIVNAINIKGRLTYYSTVLKGVHYQDTQGVRTGTTEHFTDTEGYVQIPHDVKGYLPYNEWKDNDNKDDYWTLHEGDHIIKGEYANIEKPQDIYGARTINRFENIDYGIIIEGHFGVYLK